MIKHLTLVALVAAAILTAHAAQAQSNSRCRETCAPGLRDCLQSGRPALRACLADCRSAAPDACPPGLDAEDCPEAKGLHACISACRDARRKDIRTCVRAGTECSRNCSHPGPTPTATPGP